MILYFFKSTRAILSCFHVSITAFVKTFSGLQSIENQKTDSCEKMRLQIGKLIMA